MSDRDAQIKSAMAKILGQRATDCRHHVVAALNPAEHMYRCVHCEAIVLLPDQAFAFSEAVH